MPLTFAHPAAAIPLARRGMILSALVIGSMTPDAIYFILFTTSIPFGHTLPGLLLFCLPTGLMMMIVFHRLIKLPVLLVLPAGHRDRLYAVSRDFRFWPWGRLFRISVSLLAGALTHIFWDSFTHTDTWLTSRLALFDHALSTTSLGSVRITDLLQHGGTAVGFLLIAYWYRRWYISAPSVTPSEGLQYPQERSILVVALLTVPALAAGVIYGYNGLPGHEGLYALQVFAQRAVIASTAAGVSAAVFYSALWHIWEGTRPVAGALDESQFFKLRPQEAAVLRRDRGQR